MGQDVVQDDPLVTMPLSLDTQSDWLKALRRVARAQAVLWARTDINVRRGILAELDKEDEAQP